MLHSKEKIIKNLKKLKIFSDSLTFLLKVENEQGWRNEFRLSFKDYDKIKDLVNKYQVINFHICYYVSSELEKKFVEDECFITRKWNPNKLTTSLREKFERKLHQAIFVERKQK